MTTTRPDGSRSTTAAPSVGMVILDDAEGLASCVVDILRSSARRATNTSPRNRGLQRPQGLWPHAQITTTPGATDGAGRPGRTKTTITHGILARPVLQVSTHTVDVTRMMWWDAADYLLTIANLAEGGDGEPSPEDLRSIAVASALCDRHAAHERDLVVLNSATAFEGVFLYDEGPRYTTRLESRILKAGEGLSEMIEALPRVTRVTIYRNRSGVPTIALAPFADKALEPMTDEELRLVGWGPAVAINTTPMHP